MDETTTINKKFINISNIIREVVFGVEDGMVSTLGAVTGIAVGSGDRYMILLAGVVIIAVESVSMGIGSYVSNLSSKEVEEKAIEDEKNLLSKFPEQERKELYLMFLRDGWAKKLASSMARSASLNKKLMLKEHEYRQLGIFPYQNNNPLRNAFFMFFSYIIGGTFPLISYFLLPVSTSLYTSVALTLGGLFALGVITTYYTNIKPLRAGTRLVVMGGVAFLIGLTVGQIASMLQ